MKTLDRYYTPARVARIVGVTPQAVYLRISSGKLHTVTLHGVRFVPVDEITKWLHERTAKFGALQLPTT